MVDLLLLAEEALGRAPGSHHRHQRNDQQSAQTQKRRILVFKKPVERRPRLAVVAREAGQELSIVHEGGAGVGPGTLAEQQQVLEPMRAEWDQLPPHRQERLEDP
mgnify:CR=1 FL=1